MKPTSCTETQLRQFVRSTPAAVAMFDRDLRYLHVSDRWLEVAGLRADDVIGRCHYDVVPDIPERWKACHRRVLAGATERCERDIFFRQDGSTEWLEWQLQPWHDERGEIGGLMMFTQDITERVRVCEELRASEDRFRSAMQYSPIGMALVAADGRILETNPALCEILGYNSAELRSLTWVLLTHVDDLAIDSGELRRLLDGDIENYEVEKRCVHRSGHLVWVQLNISAIRNIQVKVSHFVWQVQDVTARRRAASAVQSTAAKLTLAMDVARLGYWEYDPQRDRVAIDKSFFDLFKTTADRTGMSTLSLEDFAQRFLPHDEIRQLVTRAVREAVGSESPAYTRSLEHPFVRADRSAGTMALRLSLQKDWDGRTLMVHGISQDITERKKLTQKHRTLETQLRHAQKLEAIGTLAGGIAHEFNNLLTGIMGNIQLAEMDLADGRPAQGGLREATNSCREARDLVERLLSFSQRVQPRRTAAPLSPIIQNALEHLSGTLPATIEIRAAISNTALQVRCDSAEITQAILHIGTNAGEAMADRGGVLEVSLCLAAPEASWRERYLQVEPRHRVRLTLRDTGIGMTTTTLQRIFDPFFTTKPFGQGCGLGLAIVHGIMKRHSGAVVVESIAGKGTTVHLLFPLAEEPNPQASSPLGPFGNTL